MWGAPFQRRRVARAIGLGALGAAVVAAPGCGKETFELAVRQAPAEADAGADGAVDGGSRDGSEGACVDSTECAELRPVCVASRQRCGECDPATEATSCAVPFSTHCDPGSDECVMCLVDDDCKSLFGVFSPAFTCDSANHVCTFACVEQTGVISPCGLYYALRRLPGGVCSDGVCHQCVVDSDCGRRGFTCHDTVCVQCLEDADCARDEQCSHFTCRPSD